MNWKALIAEFIGTFALIFIGVGAIAANHITGGESGLTGIAFAHGLTIAVMVTATAAISGGHLNPAVTFGAWLTGKIDPLNAIGYSISQCLGGIFAASLIKLAVPLEALQAVGMGTPGLGEGISPVAGVVMEFFLTFFLVFVIFGTAIDTRAPKMGGLFIGLTVALDILAGGAISGAAMNPARHLGPALLGGGLQNVWVYWVGPILGGAAAALLYHYTWEARGVSKKAQAEPPKVVETVRKPVVTSDFVAAAPIEPEKIPALNPAFLERCQQELTLCIGPLANVVFERTISKYAPMAPEPQQLVDALAAEISDPNEAQTFKAKISQKVIGLRG